MCIYEILIFSNTFIISSKAIKCYHYLGLLLARAHCSFFWLNHALWGCPDNCFWFPIQVFPIISEFCSLWKLRAFSNRPLLLLIIPFLVIRWINCHDMIYLILPMWFIESLFPAYLAARLFLVSENSRAFGEMMLLLHTVKVGGGGDKHTKPLQHRPSWRSYSNLNHFELVRTLHSFGVCK